MKRLTILTCILFTVLQGVAQDVYSCKTVTVSFFSSAPLEDIEAETKNATAVLAAAKSEFVFLVPIKSFTFNKSLMQEHFNENYLESDRYPNAQFKGKINEPVDYKKGGTYKVTVTGKLDVHGVSRERTVPGTIIVNGETITVSAEFEVACKDHNIKIPSLMEKNIAETVKVNINGDFTPFVRKE